MSCRARSSRPCSSGKPQRSVTTFLVNSTLPAPMKATLTIRGTIAAPRAADQGRAQVGVCLSSRRRHHDIHARVTELVEELRVCGGVGDQVTDLLGATDPCERAFAELAAVRHHD